MEEANIKEVVEEIKNAGEDELKKVIEDWFSNTRTQGMKIGASFISIAVYDVIEKNLIKAAKPSLRDYKRAIDGIIKIVSVQLKTKQNDYKEENEESNE